MRLIDADKLEKDTERDEQVDGFTSYSSTMIDEAEIVEAIPVEWILHYVDTHYNVDNYDDIWRYIMKMHDDWEKENEIDRRG